MCVAARVLMAALLLQEVAFRKLVNKMANTSSADWTPLARTFGWDLIFHAARGGVQVTLAHCACCYSPPVPLPSPFDVPYC